MRQKRDRSNYRELTEIGPVPFFLFVRKDVNDIKVFQTGRGGYFFKRCFKIALNTVVVIMVHANMNSTPTVTATSIAI